MIWVWIKPTVTLKPLTKGHSPNASMVKQALHELEVIISQAQIYGVRLEVSLNLDSTLMYGVILFWI